MKQILINYDFNEDDLTYSQAIKVVANSFSSINYNVYGREEYLTPFDNYSPTIVPLNSNEINFDEQIKDSNGIILNEDFNQELNNKILIMKSFNKKMFVFINDENNDSFDEFLELNAKLKINYSVIKEDIYLNKENVVSNPDFQNEISIKNLFIDETNNIIVSKQYFELFSDHLLAISNYFYKRNEINQSKGFFGKINSKFKIEDEEIKTLYTDLIYPFYFSLKDSKIYLILERKTNVNIKIKAINILSSLLEDKLDLNNN